MAGISLEIKKNEIYEDLKIYPNPTNGEVIISFGDNLVTGKYQIMDISGKVIYSNTFTKESQIKLFINWSIGTYLIRIYNDKKKETLVKVIKQ
jgi:hypothetical protein